MASLMTDLSQLDDKPFPLAFFCDFWLITYFLNSYWAFKQRLNTDEQLLLPLIRPVFEITKTHLTTLVEAVLSGGFCKMVIPSLFPLSEGTDCYQKVFPYRYLCWCKACNTAASGEHLTVDNSC